MKRLCLLFLGLFIAFYTKAEQKVLIRTIEGQIISVCPTVIGDAMVYFTLKGRKEMFVVSTNKCSEANFMSGGNKVKISYKRTGKNILYCQTFEILQMMDVEGSGGLMPKKKK